MVFISYSNQMRQASAILLSYGLIREKFSKALTTSISEVMRLNVNNAEFITVYLNVTGGALTAFTISSRGHEGSPDIPLFSSSADYDQPNCPLKGVSGDLTTLSGAGFFKLETRGDAVIIIDATSSSTSTIEVIVGG